MNWHETILSIRTKPEFSDLVRLAYFDEDLSLNVKRFGQSEEFAETLKILKQYAPNANSILDIGAGNGISSVNFALQGYTVTAVEPDSSDTVGANAIRKIQKEMDLNGMLVYESFAEDIGFEDEVFDVVYVRQAMHHAHELDKFIAECARVLKKGGVLFTVRDHVIYNAKDKEWFLQAHPLHKYYGGENAFTVEEYKEAMQKAGLTIKEELKFFDSVINYFPMTPEDIQNMKKSNKTSGIKKALRKRIGILASLPGLSSLFQFKSNQSDGYLDEAQIAGRMYSYIALKAK